MGKRSFLIVPQGTTRRPPKNLRAQNCFFALSAAPPQTDRACVRFR